MRALPYGEGVSFWALTEMIKPQAGIQENDSAETARGKLLASVDAVAEPGERSWVIEHLLLDRLGNVPDQKLLNLETMGKGLDKFHDPPQASDDLARLVGNINGPEERQEMVVTDARKIDPLL